MERVIEDTDHDQSISPFMDLVELLEPVLDLPRHLNRPISGVSINSQKVKPGFVFFAAPGYGLLDGRDYIQDAIIAGAIAVVSEIAGNDQIKTSLIMPPGDKKNVIPHIQIPNLRKSIGKIAALYYSNPTRQMQTVGVTGTNGKTTVTTLLAKALKKLNVKSGFIGTHGVGSDLDNLKKTNLTTPGPFELQAYLQDLLEEDCESVMMEVSSHAIKQYRAVGVEFDTAVLTNVTRDHLDYHRDLEDYIATKERFITDYCAQSVVLNLDDAVGRKLATRLSAGYKVIGYSLRGTKSENCQVVRGCQIRSSQAELSMVVVFDKQKRSLKTKLMGDFNVSNLLAVVATLMTLGYQFEEAVDSLQGAEPVGGRMEVIHAGKSKPVVVVDYAHSPSALEAVLLNLRQSCRRKLICVFGCGGERDQGKRKIMGKIAETHADYVVLTDDNPRDESPKKIMTDILKGFLCPWAVKVIHDRTEAIMKAISDAMPGDIVLIAGKGNESYQIMGGQRVIFSDKEKAEFLLSLKEEI
ncbi:MAG: UDP-N-acetylmuramoyl-L-alanyl-D-glutamate--2,6-diaminopimelate ligase [Pseudomonadota bacterium]|nr:UDP-N-acetylmuramoyl-L-alanyl-D-glutamate--2,6-diaminopimelate ligase [Pseudomonadota bacterium]